VTRSICIIQMLFAWLVGHRLLLIKEYVPCVIIFVNVSVVIIFTMVL
jgi:hypothetical protein